MADFGRFRIFRLRIFLIFFCSAQIFFDFFSAGARVVGSEKLLGAGFELVFSSRFWCRFLACPGAKNGANMRKSAGYYGSILTRTFSHTGSIFFAIRLRRGGREPRQATEPAVPNRKGPGPRAGGNRNGFAFFSRTGLDLNDKTRANVAL